jgi:hypothetical protein
MHNIPVSKSDRFNDQVFFELFDRLCKVSLHFSIARALTLLTSFATMSFSRSGTPSSYSIGKKEADARRHAAFTQRIAAMQSNGTRYQEFLEQSFSAIGGTSILDSSFGFGQGNSSYGTEHSRNGGFVHFHTTKFNPNIRYDITDSPCDRFCKKWNDPHSR